MYNIFEHLTITLYIPDVPIIPGLMLLANLINILIYGNYRTYVYKKSDLIILIIDIVIEPDK